MAEQQESNTSEAKLASEKTHYLPAKKTAEQKELEQAGLGLPNDEKVELARVLYKSKEAEHLRDIKDVKKDAKEEIAKMLVHGLGPTVDLPYVRDQK